ncbi:MAG: AhpC/TSA family protein [Dysgonamonadaceae bacterium]|jgi:peroxiredoxin|nr:AhpC/TSA family protein [Dysgonamonadaceae bacterium]
MNGIKYIVFFIVFIGIFLSCKDENAYIVKGNIKGIGSGELYFAADIDSALRMDTVPVKDGKFTYRGQSDTVIPLIISYKKEKETAWITVWVSNGENVSLSGDADYPELIMVKNGETNDLLSDFKNDNKSLIKERGDLRDKILANSGNVDNLSTEINEMQLVSQIKNLDQILKTKAEDFVEAHPSAIASLVLIQDYIMDTEHPENMHPYLSLITGEAEKNKLYQKLEQYSSKYRQTLAGNPAPDFKAIDVKRDTIDLKAFKDKYLVVNFAASWCSLCEPEYADLVAIRDTFPKKEVELLTISLDENAKEWTHLAKEKGIDWVQVIDSAGWDSGLVSHYNVSTIPCNYLIDKEGKIIGSKIPADSIISILTELIKH